MPDIDSDLDDECNPHGLNMTDRKNAIKEGGEFDEEDLGKGD